MDYVAHLRAEIAARRMSPTQVWEGAMAMKDAAGQLATGQTIQGKSRHELLHLAEAIRQMVAEVNAAALATAEQQDRNGN